MIFLKTLFENKTVIVETGEENTIDKYGSNERNLTSEK